MSLLLPDQPVPADTIPRLTIVGDITEVLNRLDQEILTRSRTTNDADATTPDSDSNDQGSGSWPPVLVIAEPPPSADRIRLAAILLQGASLGIDAVILGPWPTGDTITIDHHGHPTPADPSGLGAVRPDLTVTDLDTARTILRSLASAPPQQPHDQPPVAPDPPPADASATRRQLAAPKATGSDSEQPSTTPIGPPSDTVANPGADGSDRPTSSQLGAGVPGQPSRKRVDVQVLGATPHLTDPPSDTVTPPPWRPQARELLAYLICHPRGVAEHILFEDVLGDVAGSKVRSRLNTYVYNLHQQLRATGGPGTYITHTPRGHVMIDPDRVDSDLWRLHHHLHNAAAATDTDHRNTELRAAVAAYTGPLAGGLPPV
jgi:hypothetical protein